MRVAFPPPQLLPRDVDPQWQAQHQKQLRQNADLKLPSPKVSPEVLRRGVLFAVALRDAVVAPSCHRRLLGDADDSADPVAVSLLQLQTLLRGLRERIPSETPEAADPAVAAGHGRASVSLETLFWRLRVRDARP